ncbi:DUF6708 domain-containing protein [Pseudomonas sp. Leaf58]|uniref:DUF6708 domain-containing protein n=1 Tax=Pseudomonas sp. Leaf58 TaxID=1736226 RepID=UPI001F2E15D9|nr:DUF6708 domain-containing protein [Pseudomonas sp. Leaf58]
MSRPTLNPPCTGWKEDLPAPCDAPLLAPHLGNQTPNHQDSNFLEIPRSAMAYRGVVSALALVLMISTLIDLPWMITHTDPTELESVLILVIPHTLITWCIVALLRMDLAPPRDLPIRFNRARNKIYAYNFKRQWWNPFDDWSQVRAERWSQNGALPNGGFIFKSGVMLSIVTPGTHNVIDRFPLVTMGADQYAWAYICTYMQEGPSSLPSPSAPKDHNDVLWCEFALRLAPKVSWPADMDLESRSAP